MDNDLPIMEDIVQRALSAQRESKNVEFKQTFDVTSPGDWCEIIKDIVAIANSGGGVLLFGVDSTGTPTSILSEGLFQLDPADVSNKISKYIGSVDLEFKILELSKHSHRLLAFVIDPASSPIVFERPGTYADSAKYQKTAFSVGTVYFRHGAKSEPGNNNDVRASVDRQLKTIRKDWLKGVKRVVQAPLGSQVVVTQGIPSSTLITKVRAVSDPSAVPVRVTRDRATATGSVVYEELSDGIFDEINNVLEANRLLAKGCHEFVLGAPVYYRIYAERQHVKQEEPEVCRLLQSGLSFFAPCLFWMLQLSERGVADELAEIYLNPKSPQVNALLRVALLLGHDFCMWLRKRWDERWEGYAQPPQCYWTLRSMMEATKKLDPVFVAARIVPNALIAVSGQPAKRAHDLVGDESAGSGFLSRVCLEVFEGGQNLRSDARNLDYLVYGPRICSRGQNIGEEVVEIVGDRKSGEPNEDKEE